jgi:manganese/zinc/iron transport system permease protein
MDWEWFGLNERNLVSAVTIIGIAALTNVACAVIGCYLVLRRMSLLGDAIAHAVLPGLVVAYLLAGTLSLPALYAGAVVVGLLTAALTQTLHRFGGVSEDASMGVVFTSLFALGVVLIKQHGPNIDLDPDCVLSGLLEFADDNLITIVGMEIPRGLLTVLPVLALNLAFIAIFWKELLIASFDPAFAASLGFRPTVFHYALMALIALTIVASFEQVGSILVIAMLVLPGATANLLADRLGPMLVLASLCAALAAPIGFVLALWWDVNIAGAMTLVVGVLYLLAACFGPEHGLLSRLIRQATLRVRILAEDILGILFRAEETVPGQPVAIESLRQQLAAGPSFWLALRWLVHRGWVRREGKQLWLLPAGLEHARGLIRSHRLWETFEVVELGRDAERVHDSAMRVEHFLSPSLQAEISATVGDVAKDPHGKGIPQTSLETSQAPRPSASEVAEG